VLGYLLGSVRDAFRLDCGVLMIVEEKDYQIRAHRGFPASFVQRLSIPIGEGVLGNAVASGRGLVLSREQLTKELELGETLSDTDWKTFLLTPIMLQSQNLGLFFAASSKEGFFTQDQVEV